MIVLVMSCNVITAGADQVIDVLNNTNRSLQLDVAIPKYSSANILIKKLNDLQGALHKAILNDSAVEIRSVVQAGADVNKGKDNKSSLLWSILLNRYNAAAELIRLGAMADDTCVQQVIKMQDIKLLLLLVKQGQVNFDIQKVEGVICQSCSKDPNCALELIKELVGRGYNINELWQAAIIFSYHRPSEGEEAVRFLMFRGANPNHEDTRLNQLYTPLSMAVNYPTKKIVKILIEAGADINKKIKPTRMSPACTLLSYVIERKSSNNIRQEIMELLLEHGASL